MSPKILVLHHSADFDGLFCREVARAHLGDTAEYRGWDYGDSDAVVPPGIETIYMMDISIPLWMDDPRLIWIDHHKTAIDKFNPAIKGYRIDGVVACRLAWQWFKCCDGNWPAPRSDAMAPAGVLPEKHHYTERQVSEPRAIRLAGEYDIWDKRDPDAELFQHGLRSREITTRLYQDMLTSSLQWGIVDDLLAGGKVLQYARAQEYSQVIKEQGFTVDFEGLKFLACCSHECDIRSHLFADGIRPEHEGLLGFTWTGKDWRVSLYGVPGKPDIDLSAIAKRLGGGGHKQACGFRTSHLPFLT